MRQHSGPPLRCLDAFKHWRDLCSRFGRDDLASDARFATADAFSRNEDDASEIVAELIASQPLSGCEERLSGSKFPWGVVKTPAEVVSDPEVASNCFITQMVASDGEQMGLVNGPVQFDGIAATPRPAPCFNGNCDDILAELGFSPAGVLDLKMRGVTA